MSENTAVLTPGPFQKAVNWFASNAEKIAFVMLILWCMLPVFMTGYDLFMGATGRFPTEEELQGLKLGNINYTVAINFYYHAFCVLGIITLVFAILCIILCHSRIFNKAALKKMPWIYLLGALLVWAVISTLVSDDIVHGFLGGDYVHDGLLSYFFYMAVFVCGSMIRNEDYLRRLLRIFGSMMCLLSAIMLLQEFNIYFLDYCFPARRTVVFNNSNHFGYLICMGVLAFAALFLFDSQAKKAVRFSCLLGLALLSCALLVNNTFGAYLAAAITLVVMYVFYIRSGRKVSFIIFIPALIFLVISLWNVVGPALSSSSSTSTLSANFQQTGSDISNIAENNEQADRAGSGRLILWKETVQRIMQRPFFGFGPEGFFGSNAIRGNMRPHNEYLQIAGYLGIPALLLYLGALFTMAWHHWKRLKTMKPMVIAASCVTVAYLISAFVGNPVFNTVPFFWMFLGLISCGAEDALIDPKQADVEAQLREKTDKKRVWVIALAGIICVAVIAGISAFLEKRRENSNEMADLQGMMMAEMTSRLILQDAEIEEPVEFWYDISTLSLVNISEQMPAPYGLGTARKGGALKQFIEETGVTYEYDESFDYRNSVLKVTASPASDGTLQVTVVWAEQN